MMVSLQTHVVRAETILKYLITDDDATDTLITARSSTMHLMTTDFEVYQALASIKHYDPFNFNKLKKFFEVVEIISYEESTNQKKPILKEQDVEAIRTRALGGTYNG